MVGIRRLDAMRMAPCDRVGAMIDQPSGQFTLSFRYLRCVLVAPMDEGQDKGSFRAGFHERRRDALKIPGGRDLWRVLVRIIERNDCAPRPGASREKVGGVGVPCRLACADR